MFRSVLAAGSVMSRTNFSILVISVLAATANFVHAQTWSGAGARIWTDADSDDFSPQYNNGATATFTATGAGTVTNDAWSSRCKFHR